MKKAIIFTYKHSNYGAVLQCYALYHYLSSRLNLDVKVLDYTTQEHLESDKIIKKRSSNTLKNLILMILSWLRYIPLRKRIIRTRLFKNKLISFTRRYSNPTEVIIDPPIADIYVTGSDQVFNINSNNRDVYFLNFPKKESKKIAYSPSFGTIEFDTDVKKSIKSYVADFDALSCREDDGALLLSDLTGKKIQTTLDPTLLLSPNDWLQIAVKPSYNKDYILIYDLNGKENLINIAKRIQEQTKLRIVCITDKIEKFYHIDKQIYSAGPAEFVGLFANASYVVTDSFHGTIFSIQFHKPFYTYIAIEKSSSRISSLLNKLNLSKRILRKKDISSFNPESIDFKEPETRLLDLRQASESFLASNCNYL